MKTYQIRLQPRNAQGAVCTTIVTSVEAVDNSTARRIVQAQYPTATIMSISES